MMRAYGLRRLSGRGIAPAYVFHGGFLVKFVGFALYDVQGILRAGTQTGSQPVAVGILDQFRLAVDDGYGAFGTVEHAQAAAIAALFIYLYYFAYLFFHYISPV
jgi:hypothetical protein